MTDEKWAYHLALPPSGRGAGVLVLHPWWGLNDFIRGLADRLAREGFVALAPDLFSGKVARTVAEAEELLKQSNEANDVPHLVTSAFETLRHHPAVSGPALGIVGFSFGGSWALWLAAQQPEAIRAVTIFYSDGEGDFTRSKAAFLGHFAETDPYEPPEAIAEVEKNLKSANRPVTFYTYPGTGHWFFEQDRPDSYNPQAAELAWERTLAFLRVQLG